MCGRTAPRRLPQDWEIEDVWTGGRVLPELNPATFISAIVQESASQPEC